MCRWCRYHVCYDCGVYYSPAAANGERPSFPPPEQPSHSRRWLSALLGGRRCLPFGVMECMRDETIVRTQRTFRTLFHERVREKQRQRAVSVAISKYYEMVSPADGEIRTRQHRRGSGIAEDCRHAAFSEANLLLCAAPGTEAVGGTESPMGAFLSTPKLAASEPAAAQLLIGLASGQRSRAERASTLARAVVRRTERLLELVAQEVREGKDCMDLRWAPVLPELPGDELRDLRPGSMLSWILEGGDELGKLKTLCEQATKVMQAQPVVSEVEAPAKVFGDVHGQFRDMLLLFHFYGRPGGEEAGAAACPVSHVFNGDWVDRGRHQLEVVTTLFAMKILHPNLVWLNRGNHEDQKQNLKTSQAGGLGFDRACTDELGLRDGEEAFAAFHRAFEWLPLAARVDGRILVLHGGLGSGKWTLDDLRAVERPLVSDDLVGALNGVIYNILWSDPVQHTDSNRKTPHMSFGVHSSHRAKHTDVMKVFGRDVTEHFCKAEKLALIIRSHQFKSPCKGYEVMHDGWLVRVFSARNYCGRVPNDGGVLLIGRAEGSLETLLVRPQIIERSSRQASGEVAPMVTQEPYCPLGHLMQLVRPTMTKCALPLWSVRNEDESIECSRCGAEEIQRLPYFHCRGCGSRLETSFHLCSDCASELEQQGGRGSCKLGGLSESESEPEEGAGAEPGEAGGALSSVSSEDSRTLLLVGGGGPAERQSA